LTRDLGERVRLEIGIVMVHGSALARLSLSGWHEQYGTTTKRFERITGGAPTADRPETSAARRVRSIKGVVLMGC
jgi:hypothetical protein